MGFAQFAEGIFKFGIHLPTICLKRAADHIYTTKRVQCSFQWLVGLQANNFFQPLLDITGSVGSNGRGNIGIKINRRMGGILDADPIHHLVP